MKKLFLFIFVLVVFVLFFQIAMAAEIELTACTVLDQPENATNTFVWNSSVLNSGNKVCINITQPNIEFVCSNLSNVIDGDDGGSDFAIQLLNVENITIRDCNITDWGYGLYILNATNLNITNISIYSTSTYDILAYDLVNTTIKKSTFNSSAFYGIYFTLWHSVTVNYTTIEENVFVNLNDDVIQFESCINSTINNNTFLSFNDKGIKMTDGGNNTISNNTFLELSNGNMDCSIDVNNYNYILNNNLTGSLNTGDYGICAQGTGSIFKNNIVKNHSRNVWIDSSVGNYIENLNSSGGTYGIYIGSDSYTNYNNTILNSNIKNNSYGIYFYDSTSESARGNIVIDSIVNDSEFSDILSYAAISGNLNNSFLNVTYDSINITNSSLSWNLNVFYVKWYLDIQVIYENGSYGNGATINISDRLGRNITLTANANGFITQQNTTEIYVNYTDLTKATKNFLNNYTIHVYKEGSNSSQVNFTQSQNTFVNLTINNVTADTTAPAIIIHSPENTSYAIGTTNLGFNVSLDEDGSWCGYSLNGAANVTMTQFNITYYNYTETGLTAGSYNVSFSCNDTSNNFNATSIVFQIISASTTPVQEEDPGGGGGVILPYCGDGICNEQIGENCTTCPQDCGECCFELCETYAIVPGNICCEGLTASTIYNMDCFVSSGSCYGCEMIGASVCTKCGNGYCEYCENYCNCPQDCAVCENLQLDVEMIIGVNENFLQRIFAVIFNIKI